MDILPEAKLAELLGDSLEQAVKGKTGAFGNLLTREAAIRLICQENGISTERKLLLSEARASMLPFSFSARVDRVFPIQQFPGGSMRTARIHISDKSGEATLVLWNEQAKLAEGSLLSGDGIECTGAYVRAGEISIGRNGSVARTGAIGALEVPQVKEGVCNVQGALEKVEGIRSYRDRKTGGEKKMLSFTLCGGGKCCRAVWWSPPDCAPRLRDGDSVVLEGASFRNGEIHLNAFSRILVGTGHGSGGRTGAFLGTAIDGNEAIVSVGAQRFRMSVDGALALLNVRVVPQGVGAATLLSIKSRSLEGKEARYFSEEGKLASLEFEG